MCGIATSELQPHEEGEVKKGGMTMEAVIAS